MKNEEKIIAATLKVVKEHTISGTRMHLIAEETGMLQSNLHYYYKSKNELMLAFQEHVLSKCHALREKNTKKNQDTLEAQLDVFIQQKRTFILKMPEYDYAELDFWNQGRVNPKMKQNFIESFEGWCYEIGEMLDQYVPDLSEKARTYLPYQVVSYLEGATIQYLIDEKSFDLDEYLSFGKQMILDTIEKDLEQKDAMTKDAMTKDAMTKDVMTKSVITKDEAKVLVI